LTEKFNNAQSKGAEPVGPPLADFATNMDGLDNSMSALDRAMEKMRQEDAAYALKKQKENREEAIREAKEAAAEKLREEQAAAEADDDEEDWDWGN